MCVIFWVNKERPTRNMVERAFNHNNDGAGIAYRKNNDAGEPVVYWKKGLKLNEIADLCESAPIPFIAHFRIASIGGIRDTLTHPFPVHRTAPLGLEGETKGSVLFHNGHWKDWDENCLRAAGARDSEGKLIHIPAGRWSDTRAMAWLCSIYGPGFMEFLPKQKGIIFGPTDMQIFDGDGWDKVNEVWCSNKFFMSGANVGMSPSVHGEYSQQTYPPHSHQHARHETNVQAPGRGVGHNSRFCKYGTGSESCTNVTLDDNGFCYLHPNGVPRLRLANRETTVMGPKLVENQATGGSRVSPSPFVKQDRLPLELAPGEVISVELATYLNKEKLLSNNKLRKITALWEKATTPGTKAGSKSARRAAQALRQMSITIINQS